MTGFVLTDEQREKEGLEKAVIAPKAADWNLKISHPTAFAVKPAGFPQRCGATLRALHANFLYGADTA